MMRWWIISFLTILSFDSISQSDWKWAALSPLPISTTNNAVVASLTNEEKFIYNFGGITDPTDYNTIHQRVFKYTVSSDNWTEINCLADTLAKISSATSYVKNKIYITGGKHLTSDSTAVSSNKTHIFNPFIDTFEVNGNDMPVAVHDHVQAVWRDSLIFLVGGMNNNQILPDVQIYNPSFDSWSQGTPVPDNSQFKSFGATGYILGDTIFYFGGAHNDSIIQTNNYFRKGVINKNDPTQIEWSFIFTDLGEPIYRGACSGHNKTLFWVGGSEKTYLTAPNDINTNLPVFPNHRLVSYNLETKQKTDYLNTPYHVMDINGIAKLGGGNWIIAGGLDSLNNVSNRTILLHNPALSDLNKAIKPPFFKVNETENNYIVITKNIGEISVYDVSGKLLYRSAKQLADLYISRSKLSNGILLFVYNDGLNLPVHRKRIKSK
ncbi:hypothetical protein CW751_12620 [Brumimicrobium salinarum]|uniref:Uncharacterized protein n=1 Tax=Brumimicrobium salinarum TaxID=2058658 RepID=A0A2I0R0K3_9FLAO|nr:hypothetical protein [Brumimicrobium salinarum]PKR79920.1 hypothetical protein CW751_12620 [Brumimicrobium salinarum]